MRRPHRNNHSKSLQPPDWIIIAIAMVLLLLGVVMVLDASIIEAYTQFSDKYYFAKLQIKWLGLGLVAMVIAAHFPLELVKKLALPAFIGALVLLILVLIPGIGAEVQGARRWIRLGSIVIQPSELTKLAAIIYLPAWLIKHQKISSFLTIVGIITVLLMLQPDLGTTMIIVAIATTMFFVSGASLKHLGGLLIGMVTTGILLVVTSPYRLDRLKTFIDPTSDPLGKSYHVRQVLISLGSGGLLGTGFGRSRQKFQFLPESTTDSIFAVIGEETGFVGAALIVLLFTLLIFRMLKIASRISDPYAQLVLVGALSWIGFQVALNLSAMVALVPLTGVPLPFISYGGSALITTLAAFGLAINASRYRSPKIR
jgi:cell division protein FtsW